MNDPSNTAEVAIEQRLIGIYSASLKLLQWSERPEGLEVLSRPQCVTDLEFARDYLSLILDKTGGK